MKNIFVWGNPLSPPFLTLFFAIFAVLVSGCSETSITEVDHPEDEDTPEVVLNEEPPELVAAYESLVDEIVRDQLDGVVDSTKVLQANRMAVQLSKYHGPMRLTFQLIQAKALGKSREELKEIAYKHYGLNRLQKMNNPCTTTCASKLAEEVEYAIDELNNATGSGLNNCTIATIAGGIVGSIGGSIPGALLAGGIAGKACETIAIRTYNSQLSEADKRFKRCLEGCFGPTQTEKVND